VAKRLRFELKSLFRVGKSIWRVRFRKFYIGRNYWLDMAETINMEKMYREILAIRREVQLIKNHMTEIDVIMTPEEETQLEETLELHERGKTRRFEDLKKELGD